MLEFQVYDSYKCGDMEALEKVDCCRVIQEAFREYVIIELGFEG